MSTVIADPLRDAKETPAQPVSGAWLFSRRIDLCVFGGSAAVALAALLVGDWLGVLHEESPEWTWVSAVLLIDVAHVYATAFRVYFDTAEFRRRRGLYVLTPLLTFAIGAAIHSESSHLFWRLLAYMAVFHFVRQQYGWVALYRSRAHEHDRFGWWVDSTAIYLATVYPLIHWHANLPRHFEWFVAGDFGQLPQLAEQILRPIYWTAIVGYFVRAAVRAKRDCFWTVGKDIVVLTTAVCWYVGIVSFNSNYAFTVTNVIIHGVPYFALVFVFQQRKAFDRTSTGTDGHAGTDGHMNIAAQAGTDTHANVPTSSGRLLSTARRVMIFIATLWVLAYIEEFFWDRAVWDDRAWLFGDMQLGGWQSFWVPLLAIPQVTHYVLDGFIWRRRSNADLDRITSVSRTG